MRNYKLWVGTALMALSIYLIIKLYDNLFLSLKVPIVAVGPDGVLKIIGRSSHSQALSLHTILYLAWY